MMKFLKRISKLHFPHVFRFETVQLLLKSHPELLACYTNVSTTKQQMFTHTPLHLASRNGHRCVNI